MKWDRVPHIRVEQARVQAPNTLIASGSHSSSGEAGRCAEPTQRLETPEQRRVDADGLQAGFGCGDLVVRSKGADEHPKHARQRGRPNTNLKTMSAISFRQCRGARPVNGGYLKVPAGLVWPVVFVTFSGSRRRACCRSLGLTELCGSAFSLRLASRDDVSHQEENTESGSQCQSGAGPKPVAGYPRHKLVAMVRQNSDCCQSGDLNHDGMALIRSLRATPHVRRSGVAGKTLCTEHVVT